MPALLPSHSLMELCPSGIFSGPWTKATIAKFLFNGHGKNSGLISPNSFFLFGDFGLPEAQEPRPGATGLWFHSVKSAEDGEAVTRCALWDGASPEHIRGGDCLGKCHSDPGLSVWRIR